MNKTLRNFVLATAIAASGTASAAIIAPPPADLDAWSALAGSTFTDSFDGDMAWTLTGFGGLAGLGATGLSVTEIQLVGGDLYTIAFDFTTLGGVAGVNTFFIDYDMFVTGGSLEHFVNVSLDSTVPGDTPEVTVLKEVSGCGGGGLLASLTSTAGNPDGPKALSGTCVHVHETFTIGADGLITNATNTFRVAELAAPEPTSLALLGIGLVGLAFVRRRSAA